MRQPVLTANRICTILINVAMQKSTAFTDELVDHGIGPDQNECLAEARRSVSITYGSQFEIYAVACIIFLQSINRWPLLTHLLLSKDTAHVRQKYCSPVKHVLALRYAKSMKVFKRILGNVTEGWSRNYRISVRTTTL